ncbi:MAG: 4Fe-4S cluster-binding domain-containing protein [bacterium]
MKGYINRVCTSFIDVPDKIAIAIYFSGCSIRCKNCQNKELWDKKNGTLTETTQLIKKIDTHPLAEYVVFLGGEPTDQIDFLIDICKNIKNKKIAVYSGREFEILPKKLLDQINLIVCGPYRDDLFVANRWPASTNQRVFRKESEQWKQIK